jgi:hypothetical protein
MEDQLELATHHFKEEIGREKDRDVHSFLDNMYHNVAALLQEVKGIKIPAHEEDNWKEQTREVYSKIQGIRAVCEHIVGNLHGYAEHAQMQTIAERELFEQAAERTEESEE